MAENLNPIETTENTQSLEKIANETEDNGNDVSKIRETLEGFTPIVKDTEEIKLNTRSIANAVDGETGWFYKTLTQILGYYESEEEDNVEAKSLQESMADSLSGILDFNDITATENKLDKKENKKKPKMNGQFNDLKELPFIYGTLGAVLTNAINDKNKGEKKGISGFFKGIMEGIGGIASLGVALLAFAGATLLFNFVDWGKAVIGMVAFTIFTLGMVTIAKNLSAEQKDLIKFAESSLIMSAALGTFAISLYIASALMSLKSIEIGSIKLPAFDIGGAIAALILFNIFEKNMIKLAKKVGKDSGDFVNFAAGSLLMSAALVTFSVGLVIASNIFANGINLGGFAKYINGGADNTVLKIDPIGAIAAVGTFLLFETGLAGVARIMGKEVGNFTKFALGSIVMSGALVAFAISLVVVSHLFTNGVNIDSLNIHLDPVDPNMALLGVGTFTVFMIAMAVLANASSSVLGPMAILGAVSILMSTSLILFAGAMAVVASVVSGDSLEVAGIKFQPPQGVVKNAFIGLASMAGFMVAFAGLGALFLVPFAGAALAAGIAIASGILISIAAATVLMSKAMMLAGLAITGGTAEIAGEKYNLAPYNEANVDKFFNAMEHFIDRFKDMGDGLSKKSVKAIKMVNDAVMPIIKSMDKMLDVVIKAGKNYDDIMKIVDGDSNALDHLMDPVLYVILGHNLDGEGGLMYVANHMTKYGAKVLKLVGEALVPITDAMLNMIDVVVKAANNKQSISELMSSEGGMQMIEHLLDPVIWMILGTKLDGTGGLMWVAENMSKRSVKVLKMVAEAMVPLIDAMDKMLDVVVKAATLNSEDRTVEELVSEAMYNIDLIMIGGNGIKGFLPMFVDVAGKLGDTSKDAVEAISAMPPMVQALGDLVGIVAKAGELDPKKIQTGIFGLNAMTNFLENFIDTIGRIIPGGVGGFFKRLGSGDPIDKLKEAHKYLQPGGEFYVLFQDLANIAKTFDGEGFENLAKVSVVSSFTTGMLESSVNFKDIMSNISKGLKEFTNPAPLDAITNSLQRLTTVQNIGNKFDPIYELANKQVALHSVASDLEKIANSYQRLGAADKLGRLPTDFSGNIQEPSIAEQKGSNEGEQSAKPVKKGEELAVIANILNEWNAKGVKVYGIDTGDKKKAVKTINI